MVHDNKGTFSLDSSIVRNYYSYFFLDKNTKVERLIKLALSFDTFDTFKLIIFEKTAKQIFLTANIPNKYRTSNNNYLMHSNNNSSYRKFFFVLKTHRNSSINDAIRNTFSFSLVFLLISV